MLDIVIDDGLSDIVAGRFDAGIRIGERLEKDMIAVRLTPDIKMIAPHRPNTSRITVSRGVTVHPARDWCRSPAYQKASRHCHLGADYAAVIVEGAKPPAAATSIPE